MRLKSLITSLLTIEAGILIAKVSPDGKPIGIKDTVNTLQPYINAILIELVILLVLAVLILLKVQSIDRSRKEKVRE